MKANLLLTASLLVVGLLASQAFEYSEDANGNPHAWESDNVEIHADASAFPEGSAWRAALGQAVDYWNLNPSNFRFNLIYNDNDVELGNGESEIWWSDDEEENGGYPAVCYPWYEGRYFVEKDIVVNSSWPFTTSAVKRDLEPYGGDSRPIRTTLLHELGHALGLKHENDEYSIMGRSWTHLNANGDSVRFYPGEDACDGAVFLYGMDLVRREDVSVTHWKYSGAAGEYSSHVRTLIRDSVNHRRPIETGTENDPTFRVFRGQEVRLQFTLENSGTSTQTPLVHFVLSEDSWIGPDDTLLDTRRPTIVRNNVYTTRQTLTIPNDLTRDHIYYLGIIVDADNAIAEVRENNNATYVGIRIE